MTSMAQTKNHCATWADKGHTSFKWSLKDWTLLRDHYSNVISPEFVLHNTDGKTCTLNFKSSISCYISVDIQFPMGIQFHTMRTILSILDENSAQLFTTEKIFRNSEQPCTVMLNLASSHAGATKYLRDDTLTFLCEFTIVKSVIDFAFRTDVYAAEFSTYICKNLKVILDSQDLCDVTFVVGGKKLYAHKLILAANSDVFRAMFTTDMKELEDGCVEIIDTDYAVFESFFSYMYTGQVNDIESVVEELIVVADKYQVMNLKSLCERYMLIHINDDTVIAYLLKAYQLSCDELQKNCIHFIRANTHVLRNSSDLVKLSEYPSIVSEIFDKKPTGKLVKAKQ